MQSGLRILHLTAGSDLGGVSRYLRDVSRPLQAKGWEITLAGEYGRWHDLFVEENIEWVEVPMKGGPLALRQSVRKLSSYLQEHPVDLLHAHYRKGSLVGRRLAKRFNLPLLYTLHLPGIPMRGVWRWLSDFGDHCHAPSAQARQWLIDVAGVSAEHITVIPHGIDSQQYPLADEQVRQQARQSLDLPKDATVAAFVGRFEPQKNPLWFVDVAKAARTQHPDIQFVMIGGGPGLAQIQHAIQTNRLESRLHILEYGDPHPVYQACDALLLPSQEEGFALVCTEAMSVGRTILRTQTPGAAEQIIEGKTGCAVPVDHDLFVDASIQFLSDREKLRQMGQAAAEHVRQHLRFDRQIEKTMQLYREMITKHRQDTETRSTKKK